MSPRTQVPEPGELRPYEMPVAARTRLANGLTVLSAHHAIMPVVTVRIILDAGTVREPATKAGLSSLMAESLDTGAAGRAGETLAWEFERLGIELATEAADDASWIRATVPVDRLDPALALLADVVQRPDFPATEVGQVRDEQLAEILQRRAEPRALASDMILHFLYGDDTAYGRPTVGLPERVRLLSRDDVTAFHGACVGPQRTTIVVVGAIEAASAHEAVQRHFGGWTHATSAAGPIDAAPGPFSGETHIVDRPGAVQSEIRVAHVGVPRKHPDYFALRVMNTILGGAFTSRLNLSLRERFGYTYGVRSGFASRRGRGPFTIQTAVATDVTHRAVEEIVREVRLMHDAGATSEEVDNARDYLAGVVPLELQTTDQVSARFAELALFDLPDDYYAGYRAAIRAVSADDVARVAREHLLPDRLTVCVVGDAASIREPLEATGSGTAQVHRIPD